MAKSPIWLIFLATSLTIAVIDDFYRLPGDDADKTLFFTIAMTAWAYSICGYYYAYCALERGEMPAARRALCV